MKRVIKGLFLALAAALSGCVSVLPEAAPAKPRLHITAPDPGALTGEPLDFSLVVDDPRSTRVYDTTRIAVAAAPGRIEYLASAEWADRAPRLFQTALIQTFEDAGRILAVGDRLAVPVADLVLQTDVRRMEFEVSGRDNTAIVSVYARLSNGKGTVYAARKFEARAPARSSTPDEVYQSFDAAFDEVITGIVGWAYEAGERQQAAS